MESNSLPHTLEPETAPDNQQLEIINRQNAYQKTPSCRSVDVGEAAGGDEMAGVGGAVITGAEVGEGGEEVISVEAGEVVAGVTSEAEAGVAAVADLVVRRKMLAFETCLASTSEFPVLDFNQRRSRDPEAFL